MKMQRLTGKVLPPTEYDADAPLQSLKIVSRAEQSKHTPTPGQWKRFVDAKEAERKLFYTYDYPLPVGFEHPKFGVGLQDKTDEEPEKEKPITKDYVDQFIKTPVKDVEEERRDKIEKWLRKHCEKAITSSPYRVMVVLEEEFLGVLCLGDTLNCEGRTAIAVPNNRGEYCKYSGEGVTVHLQRKHLNIFKFYVNDEEVNVFGNLD